MRKKFLNLLRFKIKTNGLSWLVKQGYRQVLRFGSFYITNVKLRPMQAILIVTYKCNSNCLMCGIRDNGRGEESDEKKMRNIIDELADTGIEALGLTGGEPLLREDLFQLIEYAKKRNLYVHLSTNGYLLDEDNSKKAINSGLDTVSVSLDASDNQTHDLIRGKAGAFEAAVKGLNNLNEARRKTDSSLKLGIVTVIGRENINYAAGMVDYAEKLHLDFIGYNPITPYNGSCSPDKVDEVVGKLLKLKKNHPIIDNTAGHLEMIRRYLKGVKSNLKCRASFLTVTVDCYGTVYPCFPGVHFKRPLGQKGEQTISQYISSGEYKKAHSDVSQCKDCVWNCHAELNLLYSGKGMGAILR